MWRVYPPSLSNSKYRSSDPRDILFSSDFISLSVSTNVGRLCSSTTWGYLDICSVMSRLMGLWWFKSVWKCWAHLSSIMKSCSSLAWLGHQVFSISLSLICASFVRFWNVVLRTPDIGLDKQASWAWFLLANSCRISAVFWSSQSFWFQVLKRSVSFALSFRANCNPFQISFKFLLMWLLILFRISSRFSL